MRDPRFNRLRELLAANDLAGAERLCRKAIKQDRDDVNMTAALGAILAQTGRIGAADRHLRRAIRLAPGFAKPHEDLAALHMRRKEFGKAETLFRKATELQPEQGSAWFGLIHALKDQGKLEEAGRICSQVVATNPGNVGAICLLAAIEAARHGYERAIELYRRAVELDPQDAGLHFALAGYLLMLGHPDQALVAYDAGLKLQPDSSRGRSGRLYALRNLGSTDEVIAGCRECIDRGINVGESWWSLSSLRTYSFSDDDIDGMKALRKSAGLSEVDGVYLDFALGKALDDRQEYDAAWAAYERANADRRRAVRYDSAEQEARVDAIIGATGADTLATTSAAEPRSGTPIFIVGMPRSGSTLVEQILASHSTVEATTELPYMQGLGEQYLLAGAGQPPLICGADEVLRTRIGEAYLQAAQKHRRAGKEYFTDKQPENFMYAGLIAVSLPQAKIIDVRRNPMDSCVGNFRQWFGQGKEFSYDLQELAHYYLQYRRLIRHWHDVMPGRILEIHYEELVDDTEAQIRRLLEYCDLAWEPGCLDFHKSGRTVTTASSEQVRQPIYKSAVDFWKNYDKHLGDLKEMLGGVSDRH